MCEDSQSFTPPANKGLNIAKAAKNRSVDTKHTPFDILLVVKLNMKPKYIHQPI